MASPTCVVANYCANSNCGDGTVNGTVGVLLGNGDGTFQTVVTYGSGGYGALFSGGGGRKRGWQARPAGGERMCQLQQQLSGRWRGRAAWATVMEPSRRR